MTDVQHITRETAAPRRPLRPGAVVVNWVTTTDHKKIGSLYLTTSFAFFLFGGILRW